MSTICLVLYFLSRNSFLSYFFRVQSLQAKELAGYFAFFNWWMLLTLFSAHNFILFIVILKRISTKMRLFKRL